jgi:flagellar hook-associated protein FlgK
MNAITSISLSGMQAAQSRLNVSSHNIANLNTPGFHRQELTQRAMPGGGVVTQVVGTSAGSGLETDVVQQLQAKNSFLASLSVFKTRDEMIGTLLDTSA